MRRFQETKTIYDRKEYLKEMYERLAITCLLEGDTTPLSSFNESFELQMLTIALGVEGDVKTVGDARRMIKPFVYDTQGNFA